MTTQRKRRKNQKSNITVPELVEVLRNSNLPNIIVEGKDDVIIYRTLVEDYFTEEYIEIHQAGGREPLLCLYEVLSDAEKQGDYRHRPVVFIADRDMWLFRGIPPRYEDIIWTIGYSIENDLYSSAGFRKYVRDLNYDEVLTSISTWFAWKVKEYLENNPPSKTFTTIREEIPAKEIDINCNRIVPEGSTQLADGLNFLPEYHERSQEVRNNYHNQLRGKLLFDLLWRFLSSPDEGFTGASINAYALYNMAIANKPNALFSRLKNEVEDRLEKQAEIVAA